MLYCAVTVRIELPLNSASRCHQIKTTLQQIVTRLKACHRRLESWAKRSITLTRIEAPLMKLVVMMALVLRPRALPVRFMIFFFRMFCIHIVADLFFSHLFLVYRDFFFSICIALIPTYRTHTLISALTNVSSRHYIHKSLTRPNLTKHKHPLSHTSPPPNTTTTTTIITTYLNTAFVTLTVGCSSQGPTRREGSFRPSGFSGMAGSLVVVSSS